MMIMITPAACRITPVITSIHYIHAAKNSACVESIMLQDFSCTWLHAIRPSDQ
jgi:hypothetical protein